MALPGMWLHQDHGRDEERAVMAAGRSLVKHWWIQSWPKIHRWFTELWEWARPWPQFRFWIALRGIVWSVVLWVVSSELAIHHHHFFSVVTSGLAALLVITSISRPDFGSFLQYRLWRVIYVAVTVVVFSIAINIMNAYLGHQVVGRGIWRWSEFWGSVWAFAFVLLIGWMVVKSLFYLWRSSRVNPSRSEMTTTDDKPWYKPPKITIV
jgi:hypothetical protein